MNESYPSLFLPCRFLTTIGFSPVKDYSPETILTNIETIHTTFTERLNAREKVTGRDLPHLIASADDEEEIKKLIVELLKVVTEGSVDEMAWEDAYNSITDFYSAGNHTDAPEAESVTSSIGMIKVIALQLGHFFLEQYVGVKRTAEAMRIIKARRVMDEIESKMAVDETAADKAPVDNISKIVDKNGGFVDNGRSGEEKRSTDNLITDDHITDIHTDLDYIKTLERNAQGFMDTAEYLLDVAYGLMEV